MAGTLRESGCPYRRKLLRVRPALFRGQPAFKQSARGGWEVYHPCLVKGKVIHCNFEPVQRGHIRGLSSARSEVIFICNLNIIPSLMSSVSWTRGWDITYVSIMIKHGLRTHSQPPALLITPAPGVLPYRQKSNHTRAALFRKAGKKSQKQL